MIRRQVFFLAAAWCAFAGGAEAALSVSPTRVVIQGKPGQKLAGEFDVTNTGKEVIAIAVEPEDWAGGAAGGRGAVAWLKIQPEQLGLKPGQSRKVKYTLRVPKDASGEMRAQIFFTTALEEGGEGMRSRLGAILYVVIKGTPRVQAALGAIKVHYTASTAGIAKPDRLDVALRIHNQSNVHLIPEGKMVFKDADDQVVARVLLPPGWGLLPGEESLYHAIAAGVYLKPGRYTLEVTIQGGADVQQPITLQKTLTAILSPAYQWTLEESSAPTP